MTLPAKLTRSKVSRRWSAPCIVFHQENVRHSCITVATELPCRKLPTASGYRGRWSRSTWPKPLSSFADIFVKKSKETPPMKPSKRKQLNDQIYSEASDWLIEFRSGDIDAAGRKEFYDWLRTSPEHMRAYLELAAIWNEGAALDEQRVFDDTALMAAVAE